MGRAVRACWHLASQPIRDITEAMDRTVASGERPWCRLAIFIVAAVACWFVYVPVHELLHVAGCELTGGDAQRLTLSPIYGGRILAAILPTAAAGGEYAGRLEGFRTYGSDLRYLATDAFPFLLTLAGVPLLRSASRRRTPTLAGAASVLALAPFISLTGDYFEMGSVIVTRATAPFDLPPEPFSVSSGLMALRSDDLPALVARISNNPGAFSDGVPGGIATVAGVIAISALTALLLAVITYTAGHGVAILSVAGSPQAGQAAETRVGDSHCPGTGGTRSGS